MSKKGAVIGCIIGIILSWVMRHYFKQDISELAYDLLMMFLPAAGISIGDYLHKRMVCGDYA